MMMSGMTIVAWLWVGLFIRLTAGLSTLTTTTPGMTGDHDASTGPCAGEHVLEKLDRIEQALLCKAGDGSNAEPSTKNKLLTLEAKLEAMETKMEVMKIKQDVTETKLEATETKQEATDAALQSMRARSKGASTFIRWGRTTCSNSSQLVYSGYVGGQSWDQSGGGSNYLCLVENPKFDDMALPIRYNLLYGAEYEETRTAKEQDIVCAVCRAPQVTTIMIPATRECPSGWTTQYEGYLASGHYGSKGRFEFVCMDKIREYRSGGSGEAKAANFFHVVSQCDSLLCPPYANKVVTCVVCST